MSKLIFGLLLTTFCVIFEANGFLRILSPPNPTINYNCYKFSPKYKSPCPFEQSRYGRPFFKRNDISFPNGIGTIFPYSNRWDSSNNDIPLFNTKFNSQSLKNVVDKIVQKILNMLSKRLINDDLIDSDTNKQEPQKQNQPKKVEPKQQQQQNQTNNLPVNSASNNLTQEQINEIRNKVLQRSNSYREKHGMPQLTIDDKLNNLAKNWAENIGSRSTNEKRSNNNYGENIYIGSDLTNLGNEAVDVWYNEIKDFKENDDEDGIDKNAKILHMTQLLWKSSSKMGVGVSLGADKKYYVVANYDPKGNVSGEFLNNLPKITQDQIDAASKITK